MNSGRGWQVYPPEVIKALKDALKSIYWYKQDLRLFLNAVGLPNNIVSRQGWHDQQEYKVQIVGNILNELIASGDSGLGSMRRLIQAVLEIPNFNHLKSLDDGANEVQAARRSVEVLRKLVLQHDENLAVPKKPPSATVKSAVMDATRRRNEEIGELCSKFNKLIALTDHQRRGFAFEGFLRDLFGVHDLDPRGSFRVVGEQIDGAFESRARSFSSRLDGKMSPRVLLHWTRSRKKWSERLENTLGLFISLSGFSEDGLSAFGGSRPTMILMDGEDLALVLQALVDFRELLKRKVRHASHTGKPFLRARDVGL